MTGSSEKEKLQEFVLSYLKKGKKRDLCPIYKYPEWMKQIVACLADPFRGIADYVAAPESIGFILGSMIAGELGVGFIPIRNASLSYLEDDDRIVAKYIDHNDRVKSLQVRKSNFPPGSRILLADDWIDTAATMQACSTIVEEAEATVCGIVSIGAVASDYTKEKLESGYIHSLLIMDQSGECLKERKS